MQYIETKTEKDEKEITATYKNVSVMFEKTESYDYDIEAIGKDNYDISCSIAQKGEDGFDSEQFLIFNSKENPIEIIDNLIKALQKAKKLKKGKLSKSFRHIKSPFAFSLNIDLSTSLKYWMKPGFSSYDSFQTIHLYLYILSIRLDIPWKSFYHWLKGDIVKHKEGIGWINKKYFETYGE